MGPEEAKARRLDAAALQLAAGKPAERRRRAAGCHDTQEARHDAHTRGSTTRQAAPLLERTGGREEGGGQEGREE